ncbi:MAG: DNA primase [Clostridia bacterium]|nr:DNA primase [Clostridia bacterium]
MADRLSDAWFDELLSRVSIQEVVGRYVTLTKKGRKLWACCPFHSEKTPSFSVDEEKGLYYCFGCHKGGNAITFLSEYERIDKFEAIKMLAEMARMEVPENHADPERAAREKELQTQIYEANLFAARYFHNLIWKPEGAQALKYLYARGLTDADIKRFGLGCSPDHGAQLHDALIEAGFSESVIKAAWLCGESEGRKYDMFRGRVMFPIINNRDKVLGFGGRVMGKGEPKYLNTSDTPVFSKRNGVYGLNFTKGVSRLERLVLVEGYMDTVMLLKQGIPGVVATLGTALTEEQIRLMKRYVSEVWISYDGDAAGQKAALRALDMFEPSGMEVKVIDYPGGMDPDEFIKTNGRKAWDELPRYKGAKYRMIRALDGLDLKNQDDLTEYTMRCCSILKTVTNAVEFENYLRELVVKTGYPRDVLLRQIGQSPKPAQQETRTKRSALPEAAISQNESAQMQLIALLAAGMIPANLLEKDDFDNELYAEIYENLSEGVKPREFIDSLPEEQMQKALEALNFSPLPDDNEKGLKLAGELLDTIRSNRINSRISLLTEKLKTAEGTEKERLTQELNELLIKL